MTFLKTPLQTRSFLSILCVFVIFSGCANDSFVYQRSVSELNQKAAQLMRQGDYSGAVGRLESAHDLMPKESSILFNLAIAYKENEELDKSIQAFEEFIKHHENDKKLNDAVLSLGIVLEEKADNLVSKAIEADDKKEKEAREEFIEKSIDYYQRAEKAYRISLSKQEDLTEGSNSTEEIQNQIESINKSIEHLKAGKLSEITIF